MKVLSNRSESLLKKVARRLNYQPY